MDYMTITYRTSGSPYNQHNVVPDLYLSDLTEWLKSELRADIISVRRFDMLVLSGTQPLSVPRTWPSYRTCMDYAAMFELLATR